MKYTITTHMPCTAEEYIMLKDCPEYKAFQVQHAIPLHSSPSVFFIVFFNNIAKRGMDARSDRRREMFDLRKQGRFVSMSSE